MTCDYRYLYYQEDRDDNEPVYRVASVGYVWRKVEPKLIIGCETISRYRSPIVTEYVDMRTGEILPAEDLKDSPDVWPSFHFSENVLKREAILGQLHPSVREFARFILSFRNYRRGVTPGAEKLVEWYSRLYGKRPANVRRNLKTLEAAGLLAGESLLGPLFQYSGKKAKARAHLGEDAMASLKYLELSLNLRYSSKKGAPDTEQMKRREPSEVNEVGVGANDPVYARVASF